MTSRKARRVRVIFIKSMYFEKIPRENRPEASCFTRRHNAPQNCMIGKSLVTVNFVQIGFDIRWRTAE